MVSLALSVSYKWVEFIYEKYENLWCLWQDAEMEHTTPFIDMLFSDALSAVNAMGWATEGNMVSINVLNRHGVAVIV